jgi:GDSL-like lipase/acylhydrolase family protein
MRKIMAYIILGIIFVFTGSVVEADQAASASKYSFDPNVPEELRIRDGLPNFFAKLEAGGSVRIAYLGGSITAANGWRPKSFAWFKSQYPKVELIEINAAISGTGSDYGACRIASDVLAHSPDLIFMEHRVNGGAGYEAKSVEGIVRQIWRKNPNTDICLVYTISHSMLKAIQSGKTPGFGAIMETIANSYGIPSIDLGVEIAKREKAGELIFKGKAPVAGKLVFSGDGVHPGSAGHDVYTAVIARSMLRMKTTNKTREHALPTPLDTLCWENATLLPIAEAELSSGWKNVDAKTDAVYRDDFGRTQGMLHEAKKCGHAGETITVRWKGQTIGFSDIPYGEGMEVEVTIDDATEPIVIKRVQREKRKYSRFFYLPEQSPGEHTAVLRVKQLPEGLTYYAGQVLVIGEVIR